MPRRKLMLFILALFTICGVLLVQMLGKTGSMVTTSEGVPDHYQPLGYEGAYDTVTPIRVAVSMDEREFEYWEQFNEKFEQEYPDLKVELLNFSKDEAYAAWFKSSQLGEAIDIILMDNRMVREFAVQGFLLPADELLARDTLGDQLKALTDPLYWNGSIWGVPADSDPVVIAWNREMLNIVGQKPPATWEGFHALFTELKKSNPSLEAVNIRPGEAEQMVAWLGAFNGSIAEAANLSLFNDAMKQQIRYTLQGASSLDPGSQMYELIEKFRSGNLLSAVMLWSQYKELSGEGLSAMNVVPGVSSFSWDGGRSFVIASHTKQLQRARQWIRIVTASSRQLDRYTATGKLPTGNSVYTKEYVSNPAVVRPPQWIVQPLQQPVFQPDPSWSERWLKWKRLWSTPVLELSEAEQAEYIITEWNVREQKQAAP